MPHSHTPYKQTAPCDQDVSAGTSPLPGVTGWFNRCLSNHQHVPNKVKDVQYKASDTQCKTLALYSETVKQISQNKTKVHFLGDCSANITHQHIRVE